MSDLIDRDDAIMAVKVGALSAATVYGRTDAGSTALYETVNAIKALPSAQPKRMKGRWINVTKTGGAELWKCSECGELELEDSYYCPNCGADMRGEEDE